MKRHEKMTAPRLLEAVYKLPGKPPRVKMIVGTRKAIESMVGGPFELTALTLRRTGARMWPPTIWRRGDPARRRTCTGFAARSSCWGGTARRFAM